MAGGETRYTIAVRGPVVLARGRACTSILPAELAGATVEPTAATCVLLGRDGTTIASPTVTISGSVARAAYGSSALSSVVLGDGYVELWTLTLGGVVRTVRRLVTVSTFELHPPVEQDDLVLGEYPDLVDGLGDYATSLSAYLLAAWDEICRYLVRRAATYPDQIVDALDVYEWHRHTTLARVAKSQWRSVGDRWHTLWLYHETEAKAARDGLAISTDRDRDGIPEDEGARQPVTRTIHPNYPPSRVLPRGWRW